MLTKIGLNSNHHQYLNVGKFAVARTSRRRVSLAVSYSLENATSTTRFSDASPMISIHFEAKRS
jgi:hypothetical protein